MVEKDFLEYIDNAMKEYKDYWKQQGNKDFSFQEFLLLIITWKLEEVLENLEDRGKG